MRLNEIESEIQENGLTKAEEQQVDEWIVANPDNPLIVWADKTVAWFNKLGTTTINEPSDENQS